MGITGPHCHEPSSNVRTKMDTKQKIERLLTDQLSAWELAGNNYAALTRIKVKDLNVNGMHYKVQFNPARIVSSAAKVDAQSIQERKCFLCPANLPAMQRGIPFKDNYQILISDFPEAPYCSGFRTRGPTYKKTFWRHARSGGYCRRLHRFL